MSSPINVRKVQFGQLEDPKEVDRPNFSPQGATSSEDSRETPSPEEVERDTRVRNLSIHVMHEITHALHTTENPSERYELIRQIISRHPSENIGDIAFLAEEVVAVCRGIASAPELPYAQNPRLCMKYDEVILKTRETNEIFEKLYPRYYRNSIKIITTEVPNVLLKIEEAITSIYQRQRPKLTLILLFKEWESKLDNLRMIEEVLFGKQRQPSQKLLMLQEQYEKKFRAFLNINEEVEQVAIKLKESEEKIEACI